MSTPDPRTEVVFEKMTVDEIITGLIGVVLLNGNTGPYRRAIHSALTTEAARVRGETWREAEQYANECEAVNTERGSILAWHKMAAHCRMQAKNLPTNQPTWSTARPTRDGWYWYRYLDEKVLSTPVVFEVVKRKGVPYIQDGGIEYLLDDRFDGEWCPIARPGEREG